MLACRCGHEHLPRPSSDKDLPYMTVIAAFITPNGAGFVSDQRLIQGCSILSDTYCKIWQLGRKHQLTVGVAGLMGPAQVWLRSAEREAVESLGELMDHHMPGDYAA